MAKKKSAKGAAPKKISKRTKDVLPPKESKAKAAKRDIEQYDHAGVKRANNPPVGLVTPETDPPTPPRKTYEYDLHLDPQLVWAGKAEHTSFEVPTVSLHVHERIDPRTIIAAVRTNGDAAAATPESPSKRQQGLFEDPEENPPRREAVEFYKHAHGWSNRLVAGDSLLVMNSLLEKEGMAGKVQMIYIDPPYGIRYGSNFQPFVHQRDVKDRKDEDLTAEPEPLRAFRDTWELGIHSYLTYLRDRLLLARELLHQSGSVFVQIGDENANRVRDILEEVFGADNFVATIAYKTAIGMTSRTLDQVFDFVIWFARDKRKLKFHRLFMPTTIGSEGATRYKQVESADGTQQRLTTIAERTDPSLIPSGWKPYRDQGMTSRTGSETTTFAYEYKGRTFRPKSCGWRTGKEGMDKLAVAGRFLVTGNNLSYKKFFQDFPALAIANLWSDTGGVSRAGPILKSMRYRPVIRSSNVAFS